MAYTALAYPYRASFHEAYRDAYTMSTLISTTAAHRTYLTKYGVHITPHNATSY